MNAHETKGKLVEFERCFEDAGLAKKLEIVHNAAYLHSCFWHYTSLDNLLKMIRNKEMWLTRSNSLALDDWNESKKFGPESLVA